MTGQGPLHVDDEARLADTMARELDDLAARSGVTAPAGFTDRVMGAVAHEPLPQPARAFWAALARRRLGAALAAVADAWRVVGGGSTPLAVRAQALALVLVVAAGSLALAGGATVGAIDLLNANQPPRPSPTAPLPSQPPTTPSLSPSPTSSAEPSNDAAPTEDSSATPEGTDHPGGAEPTDTPTPRPTATGTDDHGGGSGSSGSPATPSPTGTDDHGGDTGGSGGGESATPTPTGTDDHGGSGSGGGG